MDAQIEALGDLRALIRMAEASGELERIMGADPHLEIGALYELSLEREVPPVLLFDRITGYAPGFQIVMNVRTARVLNPLRGMARVEALRRKNRVGREPIPPRTVKTGPVMEHVLTGEAVSLERFPAPMWHARDGGRYLGTECLVITRDPDSGWVNLGTYRVQVQDARTVTVFIEPGKHGDVIRRKYWRQGLPCPMALSFGQAPCLGMVAGRASKPEESEYATAGGMIGRPIDVVSAPLTGLPLPADAEVTVEGWMPPPEEDARPEGPFGEWPGYYASSTRPEPVLNIAAIYHRNHPLVVGQPPVKPTYPGRHDAAGAAAAIWDALEDAGVPGVHGVWKLQGGGARFITVVAIAQQHAGHAQMAGLVATGCGPAAYLGRMTIVVDDDIDITNPVEVLWALSTRWDPRTGTDIIDGCWTGHIDPLLSPEKRAAGEISNSRAIFYAVRPWHWREKFPEVNRIEPSYAESVRQKWADQLSFLRKPEF